MLQHVEMSKIVVNVQKCGKRDTHFIPELLVIGLRGVLSVPLNQLRMQAWTLRVHGVLRTDRAEDGCADNARAGS